MANILIVVDVQKEFDKFIQHNLVDTISNYAEKFDKVYQIWDTHNNVNSPTHSFPKQVDSIPKLYGVKHFSDEVKAFTEKIEKSSEEGRTFKLSDGGYVVRVENNHGWFYMNKEIVDLVSKIKNDKVILVGGAYGECIEDLLQALLAFGVDTQINKKYTYDAKTTQNDSVQESIVLNNILKYNEFMNVGKRKSRN